MILLTKESKDKNQIIRLINWKNKKKSMGDLFESDIKDLRPDALLDEIEEFLNSELIT